MSGGPNIPGRLITTPLPASALAPVVSPADRCRAVRAVASMAVDAADCAQLLDALGLDAADGKARRRENQDVSGEGGCDDPREG